MTKTQSQSGSAHVGIISFLIIVIVGLLGFVLWRELNKKTTTIQSPPQFSVNATTKSTTTSRPSQSNLVLSNSNVEGVYPSEWAMSAQPMTGGTSGNEVIGYTLSSSKLSNEAQDKQGCAAMAGTIQIVNPGDSWSDSSGNKITINQYSGQDAKRVGSHYYVYVNPYTCSGDVSSLSLSPADSSLLTSYRAASISFIQSLQQL